MLFPTDICSSFRQCFWIWFFNKQKKTVCLFGEVLLSLKNEPVSKAKHLDLL